MPSLLALLALACTCSAVINLVPSEAGQWKAAAASRKHADPSPDLFFEFIPTYIGSAMLDGAAITWSTNCFKSMSAKLVQTADNHAEITFTIGAKKSGAGLTCQDSYFLGFMGAIDVQFYAIAHMKHTVHFNASYTEAMWYDMQKNGLRVFQFPHGSVSTIAEVLATVEMFVGYLLGHDMPSWSVEANVKFLADHQNYTMAKRTVTRPTFPESEAHPGDLVVILRLDGLDPMIAWGMGSRTSHVAMVVNYGGELCICESNTKSVYWPYDGYQCSKFGDWVDLAEKAQYLVSLLPLTAENRAKFDNAAVEKFIKEHYGLSYGIHTFFSGWIDTPEDNYPPPLSSPLVMILMNIIDYLTQSIFKLGDGGNLFAEDMCRRLGMTNLSVPEVYMEAGKRGMSFNDLVTIPSEDSWTFRFPGGQEGPSMVCCVFTTWLYKIGGLMGPDNDKIRAAEFTNWDVYSLALFDKQYKRPQACVDADPDLPYCQLLGDYRMTLEETYGTVKPFAHMRERCPSKAPLYERPDDC